MDFQAATIEELQAEYVRLAQVVVVAQNTRQEIHAIVQRRLAAARAQTRIRAMLPLERDALRTALDVEQKP
jgi:hypothetical protein